MDLFEYIKRLQCSAVQCIAVVLLRSAPVLGERKEGKEGWKEGRRDDCQEEEARAANAVVSDWIIPLSLYLSFSLFSSFSLSIPNLPIFVSESSSRREGAAIVVSELKNYDVTVFCMSPMFISLCGAAFWSL